LSRSTLAKAVVVAAAVAVAAAPVPPSWIERFYSSRAYPILQTTVTVLSNRSRIALFDVALVIAIAAVIGGAVRMIRRARRLRSPRPVFGGLSTFAAGAAAVYLWFLVAWGFNYLRPPLQSKVSFDASRVTPANVRALAERSVRETNRTYADAHRAGFPEIGEVPGPLVNALHDVERSLGRRRPTVPARPKRTLLGPYFRASAVSGMVTPFFLETLVNQDLTGPERPTVLAHEWAHLAGFAPESDASYVGLLAAFRADVSSQYSAWLELALLASNELHPVTREAVLRELDAGPRADVAAIRARLSTAVRPVNRAAWTTYDRMLKFQGVEEGAEGYSRVIQLVLGTGAIEVQSGSPPRVGRRNGVEP
jgi:hypothetical protein